MINRQYLSWFSDFSERSINRRSIVIICCCSCTKLGKTIKELISRTPRITACFYWYSLTQTVQTRLLYATMGHNMTLCNIETHLSLSIHYVNSLLFVYSNMQELSQANSSSHPSGVGKWGPASAGQEKEGMVHSVGCAGKTVSSLENECHTSAPLEVCSRRGAMQIHLYLSPYLCLYLGPTDSVTKLCRRRRCYVWVLKHSRNKFKEKI